MQKKLAVFIRYFSMLRRGSPGNNAFAVALMSGFALHTALFFLVRKLLGIERAKRICAKVVCIRHVSPTLGLS